MTSAAALDASTKQTCLEQCLQPAFLSIAFSSPAQLVHATPEDFLPSHRVLSVE